MIVIGLTGSIGMGKSTTASIFQAEGVPVYDADAEVRALYAAGGEAVGPVEAAFPGVIRQGAVDRRLLGDRVLGDSEALNRLNGIVWPLMGAARKRFFESAEARKSEFVVLDIPLLLETGGEGAVDVVVVVSAPEEIQRERVLAREGMTTTKFDAIRAAQMPDAEKRRRADFIVDTSQGLESARHQVRNVLAILRVGAGQAH
jgi:dephospho-CoA kinase